MIRERHEKPLSLLKWGLCRTGELSKATRGISYLLGSSWVTAGLRVPMATTSSSFKVTDFHSTAREASRVPPMWSQLCWLRNEQGTGQEGEGEREAKDYKNKTTQARGDVLYIQINQWNINNSFIQIRTDRISCLWASSQLINSAVWILSIYPQYISQEVEGIREGEIDRQTRGERGPKRDMEKSSLAYGSKTWTHIQLPKAMFGLC